MSFTIIFLIIAIANIFAEYDFVSRLNLLVKPLICISLAIYFVRNAKMNAGFNRLILAALILSFFGDCLLLFADEYASFFMFGLVAFLIAHVLYSLAFFRDFKNNPQAPKTYGHLMLFLMGVFSMSYYSMIRDYLGDLRIPVMAYVFVISIMVILAGYRYRRVNLLSFRLIYFGALFFVISDSTLAYNKFVEPFACSGVVIMGTYMLAQYLITIGSIERVVVTENKAIN
ncbi:lysoplasmalogenase [Daejeonella sp.]|uniref:lysoplasmalogenase n=1 Tax=Daejeonella sp. TaxID=2805397 RepID=UPI0030BF541C